MLRSFDRLYIKHHSTFQGNHPSGENPENGEESGVIPEGYNNIMLGCSNWMKTMNLLHAYDKMCIQTSNPG